MVPYPNNIPHSPIIASIIELLPSRLILLARSVQGFGRNCSESANPRRRAKHAAGLSRVASHRGERDMKALRTSSHGTRRPSGPFGHALRPSWGKWTAVEVWKIWTPTDPHNLGVSD